MRLRPLTVVLLAVCLPLAAEAQSPAPCPPGADAQCREVSALAARADVARALAWLRADDERALRDLVTLTEIPAPPFGEGPRAEAYAAMLRDAGADSVWIDEEGNVLALERGAVGRRVVAVAGHLDTVFPEGTDVTVRLRGDTLYAPGVGDDTRGLVVVLSLLRALEESRIETDADVLFIGTVGEEGLGDLRGVKHLFREGGPRIDAFIAVDGGDEEGITSMALGSRRYRVTFRGPGGHSWGAFGTANPMHTLGIAVQRFDAAATRLVASGPRTSFNVGRIGGGTSVNAVPFEAWMEVDMRSESAERLTEIDALFRQVVGAAVEEENAGRSRGEPLSAELKLVGDRPSGATPSDAPLLLRAMAATAHMGAVPSLRRSSTDANVPIARGIPAVTIGRGGEGGAAHSPDEWWLPRDAWRGAQKALLLLLAEAGVAGR